MSEPKRVIGFVGSPRRNGNTEILVEEVLAGAQEVGAQVEKIQLTQLNIGPCRGCGSCKRTGKCAQDDDMAVLLEKMAESHVWVFGTPLYWWGPTAQFKAFMDRWYSAEGSMFQGQRVILVIPFAAGSGSEGIRHIVGMFETSLGKRNIFATVLAPGVYSLGAVRRHKEVLERARQTGRDVIQPPS